MRDRRFKALKLRYPRTEGFCLRVCGGILQSRDMTGLYAWILIPGQVHSPSFSSGGHCPRAFEFTPDNRYIVVCNQGDGEVVSLEYNSALGEIGGVCDTVTVQEASSLAFLN